MHGWVDLGVNLFSWLGAFLYGVALALIPVVLVRRKEPSSTIAWILTLVFLPVVGAVLFVLFGRDRVRWPARRKRAADALVRARLTASAGDLPNDAPSSAGPLSELERQIFQVGAYLARNGSS